MKVLVYESISLCTNGDVYSKIVAVSRDPASISTHLNSFPGRNKPFYLAEVAV
jgi:hypothetical protein